jgi:hypothetical protein
MPFRNMLQKQNKLLTYQVFAGGYQIARIPIYKSHLQSDFQLHVPKSND